MSILLETEGLTKTYWHKVALDHVTFQLKQGEIYGLIGKNGAGKTTLMKIISGLVRPKEGTYRIFGMTEAEYRKIPARHGILIEDPGYFGNFDAMTNLKLRMMQAGVGQPSERKELLEMVGLENVGEKPVGKFSFGMKQRLGLAMALVGRPDLVILDEPINGLDPQGISDIRETILRINHEYKTTFLISSHILSELGRVANRFGIINNGKLVDEFTGEELKERCTESIELVTDNPEKTTAVLERLGFRVTPKDGSGRLCVGNLGNRQEDISLAIATEGITLLEMEPKGETMESYYLNLVGKE